MTDSNEISFHALHKLLSTENYALSTAASHGFVIGMVCAGLALKDEDIEINYQQILNEGETLPAEIVAVLNTIFSDALQQLDSGLLQLKLMLADDEQSLSSRLKVVAQWSEGWLLGFGHATDSGKLSSDAIEALGDIRNISQVDFDLEEQLDEPLDEKMAEADIEELERAYVDIIEHLKVTTEMLYLEKKKIARQTPTPLESGSIH